jgi:hypothetical protein
MQGRPEEGGSMFIRNVGIHHPDLQVVTINMTTRNLNLFKKVLIDFINFLPLVGLNSHQQLGSKWKSREAYRPRNYWSAVTGNDASAMTVTSKNDDHETPISRRDRASFFFFFSSFQLLDSPFEGLGRLIFRGFTITHFRHTTLGRTPLDE